MNNLKRVLSLGLTGAMLAGLLTVGASAADFTDVEKIQHDEAVNVLVALKVVDGKPDGSFDPEGNVTRAEMAKMIAVAMNGGNAANTGTKTNPTFTDIKGHWAESYIEYCADLGIISGRGDGTFDPGSNVTGLEATKMVLSAMGFDAAAYKLTGASWAVRTDEVARTMTGQGWTTTTSGGVAVYHSEPGMYDGLESVMMASNATRDTAAQLIWNGLQNRTRTVQPTTNTSTGSVEWTYITNNTTLLNQRFGANVSEGTFTGNYYTGNASVKGEIAIKLKGEVSETKIPSDFDISNIGEEVKVIWKDGTRGTKGTLDAKDVIFGVFNTGAARVVTGKLADVKDQKSSKAQINIGGTKYETADEVEVIVNYANNVERTGSVLAANGSKDEDATNGSSSDSSDLTKALKFATGDAVKAIIDPDDNEIKVIYVTTAKLAAVTAVNSEKVTLNNNVGAIKIADNDVAEDLKKGDVVTVSTLYKAKATDDDAFTIVKKAETVEGEVDGWKESETVTVDGTAQKIYNKAESFMLTGTAIPDQDKTITTFKGTGNDYIGEDVKLYMVNGYVGAAVQTSETASNYSVVTEVKTGVTGTGGVFTGLELQVMDGDNKSSVIKVHKDSPSGAVSANYSVGDIVTYTTASDGSAKVTVKAEVAASKAEYDDDTKTFGVTGSDLILTTTDCVVFVQTKMTGSNGTAAADMTASETLVSGAEYKAYKVRDLKGFTAAKNGVTMVTNKDEKVCAAFVNMQATPNGATDNTVYGIVTSENGRIKDYYSYTVMSNGEEYEVKIDASSKTHAKGDLVWFDKANDDTYVAADVHKVLTSDANTSAVWTKEAETGTLTYYTGTINQDGYKGVGQVTKALEKDAPVVYVDTKNDKSDAASSISAFDSVTGYANAIIIENADSPTKIKAIFIETSNEEHINKVTPTQAPLTDDAIKAMEDGTFVPSDKTALASSATAEQLRVFKFTGDGTCTNVKLTISDSTGVVYEESDTLAADTDGHYFWVAVLKLDIASVSANVKSGSSWDGKTAAPAGSYTYTITGSTDTSYGTTLSTGSFSI